MEALLPARATPQGQQDSFAVILVDLSFALDIENSKVELRLAAQIAHSGEGADGIRVGLMFKNLAQNDMLALQCFAMASAEEGAAACSCCKTQRS
jgi:hypothetical protein